MRDVTFLAARTFSYVILSLFSSTPSLLSAPIFRLKKHFVPKNGRRQGGSDAPCSPSVYGLGTISSNVRNTMSINLDYKKVIYKVDCCVLHTVLLVIILQVIITIICYHYTNQKPIGALTK